MTAEELIDKIDEMIYDELGKTARPGRRFWCSVAELIGSYRRSTAAQSEEKK